MMMVKSYAVVICFHFTIFVVLGTTHRKYNIEVDCCDLLSFYYLCRTRNNAVILPIGIREL